MDTVGDVFITEPGQVVEVPGAGGVQVTVDTGTADPHGVAVAPGSPPDAVTAVRARSRHPATAQVEFTPGPTGGDPVTYQVTATDRTHPGRTVTATASPVLFAGLVAGTGTRSR